MDGDEARRLEEQGAKFPDGVARELRARGWDDAAILRELAAEADVTLTPGEWPATLDEFLAGPPDEA